MLTVLKIKIVNFELKNFCLIVLTFMVTPARTVEEMDLKLLNTSIRNNKTVFERGIPLFLFDFLLFILVMGKR